jgi:hypothetical protein
MVSLSKPQYFGQAKLIGSDPSSLPVALAPGFKNEESRSHSLSFATVMEGTMAWRFRMEGVMVMMHALSFS